MNENLKPVTSLRPFTRFCMTIGALPSSYIMSMTYEEQLIWLCNYLSQTVIPALNNNGLAIEELQEKYVELKSYVDNYFDNLDVQEEINNKLDEMAEDGTLENLISQYIELATTYVFNNIEELKAGSNFVNGSFARTSGFYSYNDGGGAYYKIRTITNEDIIDNIHLFPITDDVTLIAELINPREINLKQLGATTEQDNKNIIQYALDNFNKIIIDEMYEVYSSLEITNDNIEIDGLGGLFINHDKEDDLLVISADNIIIKNISLTNDNIRTGSSSPAQHHILLASECNNILMENVKVYNAYDLACEFEKSSNLTFKKCSFKNCYYDMLTILEECSDVLVDECEFDTVTTTYQNSYLFATGSHNYSINAEYLCKNVTVQNSRFLNNPIWEGIDSHGCQNLKILNNYVYNCHTGIAVMYDVRKSVTNILSDNIEIIGNYVTGTPEYSLRDGITVWGDATHLISDVIIENNIIENYSYVSGIYSINTGYIKNFNITNNEIKGFKYGGIQLRASLLGIINNNHIYKPAVAGAWGINNLSNSWLIRIFDNYIHGTNYTISRAINCGDSGCFLLDDNLIFNADYKYRSATGSSSPLGIVTSSTSYRLGCRGIHCVDYNDMIVSYCTDTNIKGDGSTLSNISITSYSGTNKIVLPEGQNILSYCTIGEEITIPGAGSGGVDLVTLIMDITGERTFKIKDNILTAVTNVNPVKSSSTWVTVS